MSLLWFAAATALGSIPLFTIQIRRKCRFPAIRIILQRSLHILRRCRDVCKMYEKLKWIDQSHNSHNALVPYPTIQHSEQKCAHFCSESCIVRYGTASDSLWHLWIVFVELALLSSHDKRNVDLKMKSHAVPYPHWLVPCVDKLSIQLLE